VHGATIRRAPGRGRPGDGLWTDAPGRPLLVFTADCLPIAIARADGRRPAVAALHVGWRGLLAGIVERAAFRLGGRLAAAIGPGIGPCCYEVGEDVAAP
jgi:purine-nucleoside/S-methyl-5'-thioadenosine phosphorylase / adenosine deaminase